jgi:hypothetical protein
MKISSFSQQIIKAPYERNGDVVMLEINIDAFTPDYYRDVEARLNNKVAALKKQTPKKRKSKVAGKTKRQPKAKLEVFENTARASELSREIYADFLYPGVLVSWDLTEDDDVTPIPLNKEALLRLTPRLVHELFLFCVEQSKTVKKKVDEETEEPLESTRSGSMALHAVGQAS